MTDDNVTPMPKRTLLWLQGPSPFVDGYDVWCATCVMLYHGIVSNDPAVRDHAREVFEKASEKGQDFVIYDESQKPITPGARLYRMPSGRMVCLYPAVTVAYSVHFPGGAPMPVCWMHVQGFDPEIVSDAPQKPSPLIAGKKYDIPKEA